jgi:hypothetical protein
MPNAQYLDPMAAPGRGAARRGVLRVARPRAEGACHDHGEEPASAERMHDD